MKEHPCNGRHKQRGSQDNRDTLRLLTQQMDIPDEMIRLFQWFRFRGRVSLLIYHPILIGIK
jgi:hypothetical protein